MLDTAIFQMLHRVVILITLVGTIYAELHHHSAATWNTLFVMSAAMSGAYKESAKSESIWKGQKMTQKAWLVAFIGLGTAYAMVVIFN